MKLAAGTNIAITASGQTITIASTGIGANDVVDGGVYSGRLILSNTVSFTTQPSNQTAAFRSATFTSQATTSAGGLSLRYQWQRSDDGGTTWADIYGATSKTLTLSQLTYAADNNDRYRVVASSLAAQSVASSAAKLTIVSSGWGQVGATIKGDTAGLDFGGEMAVGGTGANTVIAVASSGLVSSRINQSIGGIVRAFVWNGSGWVQRGSDFSGAANDRLGSGVAVSRSGNFLCVGRYANSGGATTYVSVYSWDGSSWIQRGSSFGPSCTGVSLSDDGTVVAVGAWATNKVSVFNWTGSSWTQRGGDITGANSNDGFGHSVSLSAAGDLLAASTWSEAYSRVYRWNGSSWSLVSGFSDYTSRSGSVVASQPDQAASYFSTVRLSGNGRVFAVGAWAANGAKGYVRAYDVNVSTSSLSLRGSEINDNALGSNSLFGKSIDVSDDGSVVAVTCNDYQSSNIVRTYVWNGSAWASRGNDMVGVSSDGSTNNDIGAFTARCVRMTGDGDVIAVGAPFGDGNATDSGVVRVYGYAG